MEVTANSIVSKLLAVVATRALVAKIIRQKNNLKEMKEGCFSKKQPSFSYITQNFNTMKKPWKNLIYNNIVS